MRSKVEIFINCETCNRKVKIYPYEVGRARFCSRSCNAKKTIAGKYPFKGTIWNKGLKASVEKNSGSFVKRNHLFSGTLSQYKSLHHKIRKVLGKPQKCLFCGKTEKLNWANKSGSCTLESIDWLPLCYKFHYVYDDQEERRFKNAYQ